jgi:hypothetical protein
MNRGKSKGKFNTDKGIIDFLKYYYKSLPANDEKLNKLRIDRSIVRNVLKSLMVDFTDTIADGGEKEIL